MFYRLCIFSSHLLSNFIQIHTLGLIQMTVQGIYLKMSEYFYISFIISFSKLNSKIAHSQLSIRPVQQKLLMAPLLFVFSAIKKKCNNAEHPDQYGHYREAKFTMTKHHWWWKVSPLQLSYLEYFSGCLLTSCCHFLFICVLLLVINMKRMCIV